MYALRWRISSKLIAAAIKVAPACPAKRLLCEYLRNYADEIETTVLRTASREGKETTGVRDE